MYILSDFLLSIVVESCLYLLSPVIVRDKVVNTDSHYIVSTWLECTSDNRLPTVFVKFGARRVGSPSSLSFSCCLMLPSRPEKVV